MPFFRTRRTRFFNSPILRSSGTIRPQPVIPRPEPQIVPVVQEPLPEKMPPPIPQKIAPPPRPTPSATVQGRPVKKKICLLKRKKAQMAKQSTEPQREDISKRAQMVALGRPVRCERGVDGVLVPADAYAKGVLQGLQRSINAYLKSHGVAAGVYPDGRVTSQTVNAVILIVKNIGLPEGVGMDPVYDTDICRDARRYAESFFKAAGSEPDFIPREVTPAFSVMPQKKKGLLSGKNLVVGGVAAAALLYLR